MGGRGLGGGWGREGRWSPCFSRQFNNWELDEVESSFWKLQLVVIKREVEDSLRWNESKCDKFSIKSLYSSLSTGFRECFPTLCGDLGYQWRSTSLHGKCHGVESLLFTGSKEGVGLSLIVVTCANMWRRQQTTCFYIVPKHEWCGTWFLPFVEWSGLCIFTKRELVGLEWLFWGEKTEKSMEGRSLMLVLDSLKGEE